jgi:hypothetical protein
LKGTSRKIFLGVLVVLTLALAGVSGYIAYRLQKSETPEDSSASGCCNDNCTCACWGNGTDKSWYCSNCWNGPGGGHYDSGTDSCQPGGGGDDDGDDGGGNCPDGSGRTITWCATWNCPNGDTNGDSQCTTDDTGASYSVGTGNACGNPGSGCGQIDYYSGGTPGTDWGNYCGYGYKSFTMCQGALGCFDTGCNERGCPDDLYCRDNKCVKATCPEESDCVCNTIVACNDLCDANKICQAGKECINGRCRNPECSGQTDCICNVTVQCNRECDENRICKTGLSCINGRCRDSECSAQTDCVCNTRVGCNQQCDANKICRTGLTCINGKCRDDECSGQTDCECNTTVSCNNICDDDNLCPSDLTCVNGRCRNNTCRAEADCICDETVDCGDSCDANNLCPTDHTCQNGTCVLNSCLNRTDCTNNGCTLPLEIPETAIISDSADKLILGIFIFLLGILLLKYDVLVLGSLPLKLTGDVLHKIDDDIDQKRRGKFEKKVEERIRKKH